MSGFAALNGDPNHPHPKYRGAIKAAFPDEEIRERIFAAASNSEELFKLFYDISENVLHSRGQGTNTDIQSKKRKLEDITDHDPTQAQSTAVYGAPRDAQIVFSCKDVSFQIPLRKKLRLDLCTDAQGSSWREVRLVNQTSNETEYALRTNLVEQALCMAVPDKQARQTNFVLYPKPDSAAEPIVFALNEAQPAEGVVSGGDELREGDTYATVTGRALERLLRQNGVKLVKPTDAEFVSAIPQSHRKGEKGYHVRAHRGSKEGYLFFLPTGIFFGFKKPLAFFPFIAIESISYTSVLQRTFNLVITSLDPVSKETKETEFSMLDQADFAGIDEYVKRHELNDASMAAQRRAKAYNVNKPKQEAGTEAEVNGGGQDEESELQKAEQALQDAEDEEEEDYEASGGESDGEGEESEEDEEGYGEQGEEYDEDDDEGEEKL